MRSGLDYLSHTDILKTLQSEREEKMAKHELESETGKWLHYALVTGYVTWQVFKFSLWLLICIGAFLVAFCQVTNKTKLD